MESSVFVPNIFYEIFVIFSLSQGRNLQRRKSTLTKKKLTFFFSCSKQILVNVVSS